MTPEAFTSLVSRVTSAIQGMPLDARLAEFLNGRFPADGPDFQELSAACQAAVAAGWMCNREAGGIRFGRVVKPGPATHGFSVDVVEMADCRGPHHRHPNGEIDLCFTTKGEPKFDGKPAGWVVYGKGSVHVPTVAGGEMLILYFLPGGAIEFGV